MKLVRSSLRRGENSSPFCSLSWFEFYCKLQLIEYFFFVRRSVYFPHLFIHVISVVIYLFMLIFITLTITPPMLFFLVSLLFFLIIFYIIKTQAQCMYWNDETKKIKLNLIQALYESTEIYLFLFYIFLNLIRNSQVPIIDLMLLWEKKERKDKKLLVLVSFFKIDE